MTDALRSIGNLRVAIRSSADDAATLMGGHLTAAVQSLLEEGRPVLLLVSGGSSLRVLDRVKDDLISPALTIGVFDERWDPTNRLSNYAALRKTAFYPRAVARGCRLIDTATRQHETFQDLASRFEDAIRAWRERYSTGAILATIGIARDGHMGGMVPHPDDPERFRQLFESDRWVAGYDAHLRNPIRYRITATGTFLTEIERAGVYMVGEEKGAILRLLAEDGANADLPGRLIRRISTGAIYVDAALFHAAGYQLPWAAK
jgi:6-phosphogluconolactonase/glucosamine-6-phosphate isomerase/deaminase